MKKQLLLIALSSFLIPFQSHAIPPQQQPAAGANIKLKVGIVKPVKQDLARIQIQGVIRELLCVDNEVMVQSNQGRNYRVFPTAAIAGQAVRQHADIRRLCDQFLRSNQNVRVSGTKTVINGNQDAISNASVTPS